MGRDASPAIDNAGAVYRMAATGGDVRSLGTAAPDTAVCRNCSAALRAHEAPFSECMNAFANMRARRTSRGSLLPTVTAEVAPQASVSKQTLEEVKVTLRKLGVHECILGRASER